MSDPYASHLPTLRFVLALLQPKQVLELGAGLYSTPAILAHPSVEWLHSIETDAEWQERFSDERLRIDLVEDTVAALPNLAAYDLVFIDNADNATDRVRTIRAVLERDHPVTIIHDADFSPYRGAINELAANFQVFDDETPHTAVVWR